MSAPIPANESLRLRALRRYQLLDTPPEPDFDDFAYLASHICGTPMAMVTLIDETRQWFKARIGVSNSENPREHSFCAHTILGTDMLIVENASADSRFRENPLVLSGPHIRFYAGAPLIDSEGFGLGALCVIDRQPRHLDQAQTVALRKLARQVMRLIECRRNATELARALESIRALEGLLPICAYCKDMRDDKGYWDSVERYIAAHSEAALTHSICPTCLKEHDRETYERLLAEGAIDPAK